MRKLGLSIFIFYLLLLSWQPCQDLVTNTGFHPKPIAGQTDLHDMQEQNESDDCSPFCICSCCQTSVTYAYFSQPLANKITIKITSKLPLDYQNPDEKTYQNSIWQPPKLKA